MIGDQVVVTVVEVRGDVVRLGIEAPREVRVHREEVYRAVGEANAAAARASEDDITRLERRSFMALVRNPASLARTEHMLNTGKPLRN